VNPAAVGATGATAWAGRGTKVKDSEATINAIRLLLKFSTIPRDFKSISPIPLERNSIRIWSQKEVSFGQ
jgi:hypothetical protein